MLVDMFMSAVKRETLGEIDSFRKGVLPPQRCTSAVESESAKIISLLQFSANTTMSSDMGRSENDACQPGYRPE